MFKRYTLFAGRDMEFVTQSLKSRGRVGGSILSQGRTRTVDITKTSYAPLPDKLAHFCLHTKNFYVT